MVVRKSMMVLTRGVGEDILSVFPVLAVFVRTYAFPFMERTKRVSASGVDPKVRSAKF